MATTAKKLKTKETQNEYVVGGYQYFTTRNNEVSDRVERRLSKQTVDQIRLDAEIESDVNLLFDSVLSDGIVPISVITDEEDSEFQEAKDIADFVLKAISYSARPIEQVIKEMAKDAFYSAVKVGEIVLKYQTDARVDGKLVLDRINPKPNSATAFVTDKYFNVLGLVGAKRAGQIAVSGSAISLNQDEIIPREKFTVVCFEMEDNDPRGVSLIRSIVREWCEKQTSRAQWKEWLRTSAIPKKVGVTAEAAKEIPVRNADGTQVVVNGVPQVTTPQKNMLTAIEGFVNNSSIVVPFGSDVKQLEVNGTGVQFERAIKYNDSKSRKGILGDALMTGEADKDARAARESSKDVSDIKKQWFRGNLSRTIKQDIFRLLTIVNFGEEKAHLTPDCFLGDTEATDLATDLQAYSQAGYQFAPEHAREIDKRLGFTPRDKDNEVEPMIEAEEETE